MYPCSNPELVAAVSAAGGLGIVQPMSMIYAHGHEYRAGLRLIRRVTDRPIGVNIIVEKLVQAYEDRARQWVEVALEEGVRFFVTALGNPRWVVDAVHAAGGHVYHDVTERKWALKALDGGVDGLICVNRRAGGHAGREDPRALVESLADLGKPLICAGGIGSPDDFVGALRLGYAGAQLGTRFIATHECRAHADYKQAIVAAEADDIVLTEKLSGVPVSIINTPYVQKIGTKAGPLARMMLRGRRTKHWMRALYSVQSIWTLKRANLRGAAYQEYFQAGKSVDGIHDIERAGDIVRRFQDALTRASEPTRAATPT
ncbi:MAG: nitronate monooxygenase [Myxococcales bacterium]|nr:nitronate monooxygenase [Myxococcales bacterium]